MTFGKAQSIAVEQGEHSPATHQNAVGQSASVTQAQSPQSSDMLSDPLAQTADQVQQGRGVLEQLKLPVQGSPSVPLARAS
jgi:hypothetical protein